MNRDYSHRRHEPTSIGTASVCGCSVKWSCGTDEYPTGRADCEDGRMVSLRLVELAGVPVSNLFVSMEPLLGSIDPGPWLGRQLPGGGRIRWVISGGKSGRNPVPSHPDWFRLVRDACRIADVAWFFKQWGLFEPEATNVPGRVVGVRPVALDAGAGNVVNMVRVRAVDAAPKLDGCTHLDFPVGWSP